MYFNVELQKNHCNGISTAEVPTVKSITCNKTPIPVSLNYVECLIVKPSRGEVIFAGLSGFHGSMDALEGNLYRKSGKIIRDSRVSVTKDHDKKDSLGSLVSQISFTSLKISQEG